MYHFPWIKLTSASIHLKYWYYSAPSLERPFLSRHLCQISHVQIKLLFKTNLIMFFIGVPVFSYHIQPHVTIIGYTKLCAKPSQSDLFSSYIQIIISYWSNTLPIKKTESLLVQSWTARSTATLSSLQSVLNFLQNGRYLFIFTILLGHTTYNLHQKSVSRFFCSWRPYLFVHKIILPIPNNTPFVYTLAIFCHLIFAYSHPYR